MDLSLTHDQELLKNAVREFVQRDCPREMLLDLDKLDTASTDELWGKVRGMGWLGVLIPMEYGGANGSLTDAAVVFEELGRGPVPGPLFSSGVLSALMVREAGTREQLSSILPEIATGRQIWVLALTEPNYGWGPENIRMIPTMRNGSYVLNGTKLFVHDAQGATHLICAVRTGNSQDAYQSVSLLMVDAKSPGVSIRTLPGFMSNVAEITFDSTEVPESALLGQELGAGWYALERAIDRAIPVLCAYQVGGCGAVFDMSVRYSRTRVQFGTPIGRFQRVQDHIINIANQMDAARWTTYEALWKLDSGQRAATSIHMAKVVASEAYHRACTSAHEVHAGIGVMREYGLTLHTKMSRTLYHFLGDPAYHKRKIGDAMDL